MTNEPIDPKLKTLLMTIRQATLMILGAVEGYLGMERSVIPRHKRDQPDRK